VSPTDLSSGHRPKPGPDALEQVRAVVGGPSDCARSAYRHAALSMDRGLRFVAES